jgi:hypothetical protein
MNHLSTVTPEGTPGLVDVVTPDGALLELKAGPAVLEPVAEARQFDLDTGELTALYAGELYLSAMASAMSGYLGAVVVSQISKTGELAAPELATATLTTFAALYFGIRSAYDFAFMWRLRAANNAPDAVQSVPLE